jgi:hypothetical protein
MSVHHARVAYKSNVHVLKKYLLLAKKEQELVRAQKLGMSEKYQEYLENVVAALQQSLSK